MILVAQPSWLWGQRASCPLLARRELEGRAPASPQWYERRASAALQSQESLRPSREYGLKIRALFFPRDYANIDVLEAAVFQKLVQLHFAETEPVISVKLARSLEGMVQQIENHNAPILS